MKIKHIFKAIVVVPVLLSFLACTKASDQNVILYYSDPQAMYFIPVSTTIKIRGNIENVTKAKEIIPILEHLKVSMDNNKSLRSCIPSGIKFNDIQVLNDKKEIDLTIESDKKRLGDTDEQLMVGSIVNTLTELNGINAVKINQGNLQSDMDYSTPLSREMYRNKWLTNEELDKKSSAGVVYWFSKDKKYLVPVTVPILKNDVTSLLKVLKKGPTGSRKQYFENSIDQHLDIIIKAVNLNHIDIELKSKETETQKAYEVAKKAVLLSIYELNVFDTVKFITPYMNEELIDLRKINPRKDLNRIDLLGSD